MQTEMNLIHKIGVINTYVIKHDSYGHVRPGTYECIVGHAFSPGHVGLRSQIYGF